MNLINKPKVNINLNLLDFFEKEKADSGLDKEETLTFVIPIYQREFAWTDTERNHLTEEIEKNKTVFLGSIILQRTENPLTLEIIDGQQRITALLNLYKEIRYGNFKLGKSKINLLRDFDKWKENIEGQKNSQLEKDTSILINNVTFNWIIYDSNQSASETLFQRINIDSKPLSVFDEFKALFIQFESKGIISKTDKTIKWKKIDNLFLTNTQKNSNLKGLPLKSIFKDNGDKSFRYEFNRFEHEWLLRQFLAICYFIVLESSDSTNQKSFYKQSKSNLNRQDYFRKAFHGDTLYISEENKKVNFFEAYGEKVRDVINILVRGIKNNDLLVSRNQPLSIKNLQNSEAKYLLLSLQVFAMSFQTWLSENTFDHCALIFKNYYQRIRDKEKSYITNGLNINDIEDISIQTIVKLLKPTDEKGKTKETNLLKSIRKLHSSNIDNLTQQKDIVKSLKELSNYAAFSRSDLWIADWMLYFYLFQVRNIDLIEELFKTQKSNDAFFKAFYTARDTFKSHPIFSNINDDVINNLLSSLRDVYLPKENYLSQLPVLTFSADIEHWCPQNSKSKYGKTNNLNYYGNLCLIPTSLNSQLSDQIPITKVNQVIEIQKNLLPKLVLTALITDQLKVKAEEDLINFLTIFWLSFISFLIPDDYRKDLGLS